MRPRPIKKGPIVAAVFAVGLLALFSANAHADVYAYMTLHNLGCRQDNHTYSGYIPGLGLVEGDLVQVILAGPDQQIDPPLADGSPGGDDQVAVNPGLPFAANPESFTHYANTFYSPTAILLQDSGHGAEPALRAGSRFFVRAWNGPSPLRATEYFNSVALTRDYPLGYETCAVDSGVRTLAVPPTIPSLITYAVEFDGGHVVTPASISILSPNGGETWMIGDSVEVTWSAMPDMADVDLMLSRDNGLTWAALLSGIENTGSCRVLAEEPAADQCLLRIQFTSDTLVFDTSDGTFALNGDLLPPRIVVRADVTNLRLFWNPVTGAASYLVEGSATGSWWYSILSTVDTTCSFPPGSLPDEDRGYFRARSQQLQ